VARRPLLWVIDPSLNHPEDQGVAEVVAAWTGESRRFRPALEPGTGPNPETGYGADGIVLLGSAASVYERHDWLGPLSDWLRPLLDGSRPIPLLGVCFGHQLIAHLAGAPVSWVLPDKQKRVGVEESRLRGGRLLPGEHALRVVVSHREEVKEVPAGYRLTAGRPHSAIDGLEHERLPVYSFQFHPEARDEFARSVGIDERAIDGRLRSDNRRLLAAFTRSVAGGS
jgi:GMP synthase-like glutamine amidotransferase